MKISIQLRIFFFLIILCLSFSSSFADSAQDAVNNGNFTSAHTKLGGCPGKNPPHIYLDKMSGNCGCPSKPKIVIKNCVIEISCDLEDDKNNIVELYVPCPTAAATDPKYPLVKMLSGTLVEWRVPKERVKAPSVISYASKGAAAYGSELFSGFDLDIIVSTVDTGKKWDIDKAISIAFRVYPIGSI